MHRIIFLATLTALLSLGCEPMGPLPGGVLSGEVVTDPPSDWSFLDHVDTCAVETRPDDPYSVTVWCVGHEGKLYVPSRDPQEKTWVKNVLADPRVRLQADGRLYERTVVRVTDEAEGEAVAQTLIAKYEIERPEGEDAPEVWLFRLEPR